MEPTESPHPQESEFKCFDKGSQRVRHNDPHILLMTLPHHGQRVNNRSGIHPQLYPESNQETQVTVLGRQGGYQ